MNPGNIFTTLARWIKPGVPDAIASGTSPADEPGSPPPETAAPKLTGVDTDAALDCLDGNVALYRKILASFSADQADAAARMRTAFSAGDWKSAARIAHTLRGLAGNVGAQNIVRMSREIESALRNGQNDLAETVLTELEAPLAALILEIDRAMPREARTQTRFDEAKEANPGIAG